MHPTTTSSPRRRAPAAVAALVLAGGGLLGACGEDSKADDDTAGDATTSAPEFLNADSSSTSPYSDAVAVGSTLHLAGNLGLDADGKVVPGGIKAETTQMMANLKAALERNGSSLERAVNCEVMLASEDAKSFAKARDAFNEVYSTYWEPGRFPARHAFGVSGLYLGALVEIACDAVRN